MIVRTGYVSNSSSSSFQILGVSCDKDDFFENENFLEVIRKENQNQIDNINEMIRDKDLYEILELMEGVSVVCDDESEQYYVGMDPDDMDRDKTIAETCQDLEIKLRTQYHLNVRAVDIQFHSGEIYN